MRTFGWMTAIAIALAIAGCDKKSAGPAPSGSNAASGDREACHYATCDTCVGEAGCWWNKTTKTCRLGLPEGVTPEKDKAWANEAPNCK